jgi:hypothetical protein
VGAGVELKSNSGLLKVHTEALKILNVSQVLIANACNPSNLWRPVMPATQETEIRRIIVQSQFGQTAPETLSKLPNTKQGWWSGSSDRVPA